MLITEINANHEGRTPEALARNQLLIRELNGNIAKVRESRLLTHWRMVNLSQHDEAPGRKETWILLNRVTTDQAVMSHLQC